MPSTDPIVTPEQLSRAYSKERGTAPNSVALSLAAQYSEAELREAVAIRGALGRAQTRERKNAG